MVFLELTDNAGGTLTRDRWWPQAVAPTERGARWNFPVVRNTGHHFSRLPNFSLVRDHTPAPYQSKQGWRRGWRVFFTSNNPKHCKQNLCTLDTSERAHSGGYRIGIP